MNQQLPLILAVVVTAPCFASSTKPVPADGAVTIIGENGRRVAIDVGTRCTDLWVAPDESVIAFIGIEKSQPQYPSGEPFIEESSIYIARRIDGFKPIRISVRVLLDGKAWSVAEQPMMDRDQRTLYFLVPNSMTSAVLVRTTVPGDETTVVKHGVGAYCVIWGGDYSGAVIMSLRRVPKLGDNDAGVTYPCYVTKPAGEILNEIGSDCEFQSTIDLWSQLLALARGGERNEELRDKQSAHSFDVCGCDPLPRNRDCGRVRREHF